MSTFAGLGIAYSGLNAARAALEVTGQNVTNAGTAGYTRQRLETEALPALAQNGLLKAPTFSAGDGVKITGIARLGDLFIDARVRAASAQSGFSGIRATALTTLEDSFSEPGTDGLSAQLQNFWSSWQDLSNHPGELAPGSVVLQTATVLSAQIATGYNAATSQWSDTRAKASGLATDLNDAADRIATLNTTIRQTAASGGSVNELLDQRAQLTQQVAQIAGGTVVNRADGTVDVSIGGNLLVTGGDANHVQLTGSQSLEGTATDAVQLEWVQRPGQPIGLDGGQLAGALTLLAPADATGTGGTFAETAAGYDNLATTLATQVNAIHNASTTTDGRTGLDFFRLDPAGPAALGLSVIPTSVADLATAKAGAGPLDGSAADAISQLGTKPGSPDDVWSNIVTRVGVLSKSEQQQSTLADTALTNATTAQTSVASVDIDEENMNMLTQQTAYQAAARMMTAVDETLDTLINHTGLVGR